jgi:formyltetrahydrofolate deformylase
MSEDSKACLRITCPDRPGIIAGVSGFLHAHGANITALDQYSTDPEGGRFFLRLEFQTPHLDLPHKALEKAFEEAVARRFEMEWDLAYARDLKKVALLVSKHDHALLEILWRWKRGELPGDVTMVVSNHPDLRQSVESFGIPFEHIPATRETMAEAESRMAELFQGRVELIVLARYMQILTGDFTKRFPSRIINIHHSFLPAFAGADPYRQAYERGVKLIGATAHYVTADLDQGPIIEQDVARVSHRQTVPELRALGRDLERQVLARAVKWHLEDRIIIHGNKTVVFS